MELAVKFQEINLEINAPFGEWIEIVEDDDPLQYVTQGNRLFYRAVFPEGYELSLDLPNCPNNISEMFRIASGLKKLTVKIPTDKAYNASYFIYDTLTQYSTLEELNLPNGIKVSNFSGFAMRNSYLKTVTGSIDLSESTSNDACFDYCPELGEVRFVGDSIKKSISFAQSTKLSRASIDSILDGLSEIGDGRTLTLSETAVDNAYKIVGGYAGDGADVPGTENPEWYDTIGYFTGVGWTITLV